VCDVDVVYCDVLDGDLLDTVTTIVNLWVSFSPGLVGLSRSALLVSLPTVISLRRFWLNLVDRRNRWDLGKRFTDRLANISRYLLLLFVL